MATINKELAMEIIANDGYYSDDPRVVCVVKYTNFNDGESWAIMYPTDPPDRYRASPYVRNPEIVWQAGD